MAPRTWQRCTLYMHVTLYIPTCELYKVTAHSIVLVYAIVASSPGPPAPPPPPPCGLGIDEATNVVDVS